MGEPVDVIRLLAHAATANISSIINGIFGFILRPQNKSRRD